MRPWPSRQWAYPAGTNANRCGVCHSRDVRDAVIINGETVPDNYLAGKTREQRNGVTCVICHDPHRKTGDSAPPARRPLAIRILEFVSTVRGSNELAT